MTCVHNNMQMKQRKRCCNSWKAHHVVSKLTTSEDQRAHWASSQTLTWIVLSAKSLAWISSKLVLNVSVLRPTTISFFITSYVMMKPLITYQWAQRCVPPVASLRRNHARSHVGEGLAPQQALMHEQLLAYSSWVLALRSQPSVALVLKNERWCRNLRWCCVCRGKRCGSSARTA